MTTLFLVTREADDSDEPPVAVGLFTTREKAEAAIEKITQEHDAADTAAGAAWVAFQQKVAEEQATGQLAARLWRSMGRPRVPVLPDLDIEEVALLG